MSGTGHAKRNEALSIRCFKLRKEGFSLREIANIVGIEKDKVKIRIELGQRILGE